MQYIKTGLITFLIALTLSLTSVWGHAHATDLEANLKADFSQLVDKLPAKGKLINPASPRVAAIFGETAIGKIVQDKDVPGGIAFEVQNNEIGLNSWSGGVNWPMTNDIRKGDTVLLSFWAKGIEARNESNTPIISSIRLQQSQTPYLSAAESAAHLEREWKQYFVAGRSDHLIEAGQAGISFHMGLSRQTIRLGPAYILNFGPDVSPSDLPRNKIYYDGMEADAPWRAEAMARINEHRKGDLVIRVLDTEGKPVQNSPVNINQTQSAFNFGTFIGHDFNAPQTETEKRYFESFKENFNTATLPLYWADWGWTDGGSKAAYKENIRFVTEQGILWRGHPILWPGEFQMPSRILNAKGDAKKQREQVLSHVREVMGFIKDYNPIVIDMVNEVRVNQYFKENGNPELVADAFQLAHEIAPDIPLMVNDYAILNSGGQNVGAINFYHQWLDDMKAKNVPVGGIGFQGHFSAGLTSPKRVMDILSDFSRHGLPLQITEFDIETLDEEVQAQYTQDFLLAAFSEPALNAFIVWGWWEGDHWKPNAAMLRRDWSPKPNYKAWRDTVFGLFRTHETIITNEHGEARIRAFKGDYAISVGGQTVSVTLDQTQEIEITL